ncbi:hypothetical protein OIV53_27270, partial [Burkholderia pseudomallei]|nr:hypothetical protein [Burkholderia pseudomallei]
VRLAQDGDHLFFGKPALLHDFLFSVGSHSLKFQLVRKFQGRSDLLTSRSTVRAGSRNRRKAPAIRSGRLSIVAAAGETQTE